MRKWLVCHLPFCNRLGRRCTLSQISRAENERIKSSELSESPPLIDIVNVGQAPLVTVTMEFRGDYPMDIMEGRANFSPIGPLLHPSQGVL